MTISVHAVTADLFIHSLTNLQSILDKGAAHASARKFDPNLLVASRLAPDMLPLARQVQIACDVAKNTVARLAAVEPPRFEDTEKSFDELRTRISRTLDYLKSITPGQLEGADTRDLKVPAGDQTLELKGLAFIQRRALPNFFFHVATTYNILRHNGVELGKKDYLGPA